MEIVLTPDLEALIHDEVESGRYTSPGEVIRDALQLFRQQAVAPEQDLDSLRREIQVGIDDLESGAYMDYDENTLSQLVNEIETRGLDRLKAGG